MARDETILVINGGSSSIKFALYNTAPPFARLLDGKVDRIGLQGTLLKYKEADNEEKSIALQALDFNPAIDFLVEWLSSRSEFTRLTAVGHRLVHGMHHQQPVWLTPELLTELRGIIPYDPDHMPFELSLIEVFNRRYPKLRQAACFDTAFHAGLPRVAQVLPVPRRFEQAGVQRYGFHGISYSFLIEELRRLAGNESALGRVILAHLGNGTSLCAVRNGQSIDTSMGFTPTGGIPMSTRSGDLDPGVAWFMIQHEKLSPKQFSDVVNHQSGLLGISGTSPDMHDLLKLEDDNLQPAEAVAHFCYQVKKYIGAYTAALGGLDALVFSGGIGENSPVIRRRICDGLQFLGIDIDNNRNEQNEGLISSGNVDVRVIKTNEELMIAKTVSNMLTEKQ